MIPRFFQSHLKIVHFQIVISSENEGKNYQVGQNDVYTISFSFDNINGADPLMTLMSDSKYISLVLAFIGFQWLHMAASNYQSVLHKINAYPNATNIAE